MTVESIGSFVTPEAIASLQVQILGFSHHVIMSSR